MSQIDITPRNNADIITPAIGSKAFFFSVELSGWAYKDSTGNVYPIASTEISETVSLTIGAPDVNNWKLVVTSIPSVKDWKVLDDSNENEIDCESKLVAGQLYLKLNKQLTLTILLEGN